MRISTKCSVAVHSLILIGLYSEKYPLNSEIIAKSTGCNPVIIRNLFRSLQEKGIILVSRGVNGGASLNLSPEQITLWDIYLAVENETDSSIIGIHPNPYLGCPVGEHIKEILTEPYHNIFHAMEEEMKKYNLQMLMDRLYKLVNN